MLVESYEKKINNTSSYKPNFYNQFATSLSFIWMFQVVFIVAEVSATPFVSKAFIKSLVELFSDLLLMSGQWPSGLMPCMWIVSFWFKPR